MCRAFQPFTMQGIYFSLKTSFQIKISPFHLSLLQSHHILRRQKHRFFEPKKQNFFSLLMKQKKMVNVIVEYNFFRFLNNIIEQEKMVF